MPVTLDDDRWLVDTDGNIAGSVHSDELVARILACSFGTVYLSGVGTGDLRQAFLSAVTAETLLGTVAKEGSAEVVDYYVAAFPADELVGVVDPVDAVDQQVADSTDPGAPYQEWSVGVFDFTARDVSQDVDFIAGLKTLWPNAGGRVIVISQRADLTLEGFTCLSPETFVNGYVYLFDRFDPANAIGEANPHGSVYIPGYAWQP